jgi:hypothetical protein
MGGSQRSSVEFEIDLIITRGDLIMNRRRDTWYTLCI